MSNTNKLIVVTCNKFKVQSNNKHLRYLLSQITYNISSPQFESLLEALDFANSIGVEKLGWTRIHGNNRNNTFSVSVEIDRNKTFNEGDLDDLVSTLTKIDPGIDQSTVKISKTVINARPKSVTLYQLWECPVMVLKCSSGMVFEYSISEEFGKFLDMEKTIFNLHDNVGFDFTWKLFKRPLKYAISGTNTTCKNFHKLYGRINSSKYKHFLNNSVKPDNANDMIMDFFRAPKNPFRIWYRTSGEETKYYSTDYVWKEKFHVNEKNMNVLKFGKFCVSDDDKKDLVDFVGLLTLITGDVWTFETRQVDTGLQREIKKSIDNRVNQNCVLM